MSDSRGGIILEDGDPSLSELNQSMLSAWQSSRPREVSGSYLRLRDSLGDPYLAEMIWILYGEGSLGTIGFPIQALNGDRPWWKWWGERNTILSLSRTREGKARVWRMLHDAGAWL